MAFKRYRQFTLNAPAAALTPFTLSTPDDNQDRVVTGIIVVNAGAAAGVLLQLTRTGYDAADFDSLVFSTTYGMYELNLTYKAGIQITFQVNNTSGANQTAIKVHLRYEIAAELS